MRRSQNLVVIPLAGVLCCVAAAQNTNEVHVQPRSQAEEEAQKSDARLKTHTKPFVSNVDVVLVPVTVTDPLSRIVTGLEKKNFRVLDNDQEQGIDYFYMQDTPISIGIILDTSGSIGAAINDSREAIAAFMKNSNPDDEFFLVTFADKPKLMGDFTNSPEQIESKTVYAVPYGWTSLWDAVYLGLSKMRAAKYSRKALLIVSDGGENNSRHTARELRRFVLESDVQIFGVGVPGADYDTIGMRAMTGYSGGEMFEGPPNTYADTFTKIATELRNQYVLGYRPRNLTRDGKFHKIRVKLQPPRGLPPLSGSVKKNGYYAPEE